MSLNLKDGILKAVKEAKAFDDAVTESKTPRFRKPTVPPQYNPPPMPPVKPVKTNPPNVGSSVQPPKKSCAYKTPCGWCSKWDKKCDRVMGVSKDGMFDLSVFHDCLEKIVFGVKEVKYIKATTAFAEYLERRYMPYRTSICGTDIPWSSFMGVPMVIDDNIIYPYEVVYE